MNYKLLFILNTWKCVLNSEISSCYVLNCEVHEYEFFKLIAFWLVKYFVGMRELFEDL